LMRPVGGGQQSAAYLDVSYSLGSVCSTTTGLFTSPTAPSPVGTHVQLTASATCTGGTPEFRYAYYAPGGSGWVYINNTFSSSAVDWNTTGLPTGNYSLLVFTRAAGNSSSYESYRYGSYSLGSASTVCTSAGISASPTSPQPAGTTVTLTGTSSGCSSPEYAFWYRLYGNAVWIQPR